MKRLATPQRKEFRPLKLTAVELGELVQLLSVNGKVELEADNVQYDSLDEFVVEARGRVPKSLTLKISAPYVTLDLSAKWASLYVSSDDMAAVGLFAKASEILRGSERRPRLLYSFWWVILSTWVLQGLSAIPTFKPYTTQFAIAVAVNSAWIVWVISVHLFKYSLVHPVAVVESKTFWQRNSDNAVVAIAAALIGAAAGVAVTKAVDYLLPPSSNAGATAAREGSSGPVDDVKDAR